MKRVVFVACTIPMILRLAPAPTLAQDESPQPPSRTKAERIADRALGNLVAWKLTAAENVLKSNETELGATPEYKTALGYSQAIQVNAEEGVALLRDAAKANPDDPAPQFYLGEVLYWQKKYDDANTAWQAARDRAKPLVDANGADPRAQYYLGASQVRLKQFGPARKALEAAREGGFDRTLVDYQIGLSYVFQENWNEGIKAFDSVAAHDSKFAHIYFYRGLAWGKLDRKDKMLNDLDLFTKLAPNAPEIGTARTLLAAGG